MIHAPRDPVAAATRHRAALVEGLRPVLAGVRRVVLTGYPTHANAGDSMIWLGQVALLRRLGVEVVGVGRAGGVDERGLRSAPPDVALVLSGGGNFGDLWPAAQEARERLIAAASGRRVVQLPQSLCYRDERNADAMRALLDAHGDTTLVWRDDESLERARSMFPGTPSVVVPDAAFGLELARPHRAPDLPVMCVSRTDQEGGELAAIRIPDGLQGDWGWHGTVTAGGARELAWSVLALERRAFPVMPDGARLRLCTRTASRVVDSAIALVGRGRVVVSDRLHAHVLCTMLGVPHVMVDTRYGKIGAFVRTWAADDDLVHLASTPREAVDLARSLASSSEP